MNEPIYLDDFRTGQRFSSGTHIVEASDIKAFAAQFDPQPFHLDAEAAAASRFGALAASGWHTAALTMRMLVETVVVEVRVSRSKPDRGIVTLRSETRTGSGDVVQVLTSRIMVPRRTDQGRAAAGGVSTGPAQ